jgi:hypothetical protein
LDGDQVLFFRSVGMDKAWGKNYYYAHSRVKTQRRGKTCRRAVAFGRIETSKQITTEHAS